MNVSSKLAKWQVLAGTLVITLGGIGSSGLQARQQGCKQECPAPVLQKPTLPPAETCCPVDPKEVEKAKKASLHAQHEAAEACKRQQAEAKKAQHELDEAHARAQQKIDDATAKAEHERSEWAEANAKLDSLQSSNEAVAQAPAPAPECPVAEAQPAPSIEKQQTIVITPAPSVESTPSVAELTPPAPMATPEPPKELPRTASPLELIGLIGLLSTSSGYLTRYFRR
jgi:hypothetical protein